MPAQLVEQRGLRHTQAGSRAREVAVATRQCRSDQAALEGVHRLGQRGRVDRIPVGLRQHLATDPEHHAVRHVAQFTHVPAPGMGKQALHQLGRALGHRQVMALRGLLQEMLEQQRNVLAPLAQGRQLDHDHVEAVVQILAEAALVRALAQVVLGGRHDAGIYRNQLIAAQALQAALLKYAQQLDLRLHRHTLDLVEEERAAAGMFDFPRRADAPHR